MKWSILCVTAVLALPHDYVAGLDKRGNKQSSNKKSSNSVSSENGPLLEDNDLNDSIWNPHSVLNMDGIQPSTDRPNSIGDNPPPTFDHRNVPVDTDERYNEVTNVPEELKPENSPFQKVKGGENSIKDNLSWMAPDGPIFIQNGQVAQWIMFQRTVKPAGYQGSDTLMKLPVTAGFMPDPKIFDLSRAVGGDNNWGELIGPVYSKDQSSANWFRVRKSPPMKQPTKEQIEKYITISDQVMKQVKGIQ